MSEYLRYGLAVFAGSAMTGLLAILAIIKQERQHKNELREAQRKAVRKFKDLYPFRITTVDQDDDPYVKVWCATNKTPAEIEYVCNWVYIVNMVDWARHKRWPLRLIRMDNLSKEEVAQLAKEIRESDQTEWAIYIILKRGGL